MQPITHDHRTIDLNRLLACPPPPCRASEFATESAAVVCRRCGARYAFRDGIVDFVGGLKETTLDAIDYDAYYGVDGKKIARAFELVEAHVGAILRRPLGSVLELGAGTGLLTSGLVQRVHAERLLVTDISPKMLELCRKRLGTVAPEIDTRICFATNDGVALGARAGEFDLALGYFVVHHILDWQKTLSSVFCATNERGVAVFVEPNRRFHLALVLVMNRVLERLLPEMPDLPGSDLSSLLNLNNEWAFTLKYADQPAVLSRLEDKHFFDRSAFEVAAREAGWTFAKTLRFDSETGPLETANVYAAQLKLSPKGALRFIDVFASELPGPFALLDDRDASPSYVFVLAKRQSEADLCLDSPRPDRMAAVDLAVHGSDPAFVYDLDIALTNEPPHVSIDGWIAAKRPVTRVTLWIGNKSVSAFVGARRVDVVRGMSRLRPHPVADQLGRRA